MPLKVRFLSDGKAHTWRINFSTRPTLLPVETALENRTTTAWTDSFLARRDPLSSANLSLCREVPPCLILIPASRVAVITTTNATLIFVSDIYNGDVYDVAFARRMLSCNDVVCSVGRARVIFNERARTRNWNVSMYRRAKFPPKFGRPTFQINKINPAERAATDHRV